MFFLFHFVLKYKMHDTDKAQLRGAIPKEPNRERAPRLFKQQRALIQSWWKCSNKWGHHTSDVYTQHSHAQQTRSWNSTWSNLRCEEQTQPQPRLLLQGQNMFHIDGFTVVATLQSGTDWYSDKVSLVWRLDYEGGVHQTSHLFLSEQ